MPNTANVESQSSARPAALDQRTLWQRAHEHLRDEIISGSLTPGTELNEVTLAELLGVSRGPIREALGRLAIEGLVTIRPRRGAVVRALSNEEFIEAYQVREALEMMAVRLAVPKLTAEDLAAMESLIEEMALHAEAGDVPRFFEANTEFHQRFFRAADNRMLAELYRQLRGQIDRHRLRSLELRGDLRRSIVEHRAVLWAAAKGDVERAVHLTSEHIRVPQIKLLDEDQGLASPDVSSR
ncbi:MAG: GntR family transcriptional regulator [Actinomycetota bacterium]|nr:GntR family transcriptional regulator [Actinomycetota bacterium]